mmetsp:Transcript_44185/g.147382  ORF Transcript_44185/g.147382 Transcript_44185/m.147382 type:complete len:227 (+) Transcript_44185:820-1500(+)
MRRRPVAEPARGPRVRGRRVAARGSPPLHLGLHVDARRALAPHDEVGRRREGGGKRRVRRGACRVPRSVYSPLLLLPLLLLTAPLREARASTRRPSAQPRPPPSASRGRARGRTRSSLSARRRARGRPARPRPRRGRRASPTPSRTPGPRAPTPIPWRRRAARTGWRSRRRARRRASRAGDPPKQARGTRSRGSATGRQVRPRRRGSGGTPRARRRRSRERAAQSA